MFNLLKAKRNPICHLLPLVGAHHILHISRVRVNTFTPSNGNCMLYYCPQQFKSYTCTQNTRNEQKFFPVPQACSHFPSVYPPNILSQPVSLTFFIPLLVLLVCSLRETRESVKLKQHRAIGIPVVLFITSLNAIQGQRKYAQISNNH